MPPKKVSAVETVASTAVATSPQATEVVASEKPKATKLPKVAAPQPAVAAAATNATLTAASAPSTVPTVSSKSPKKPKAEVSTPAVVSATNPAPVAVFQDAPKKTRASKKTAAVELPPSEVIKNAKPSTHPSGEVVTLTRTKRQSKPKDPNAPKRKSEYNDYMKKYIDEAKAVLVAKGEKPDHKVIFKQVADSWKNSSERASAEAAKALAKKAAVPVTK